MSNQAKWLFLSVYILVGLGVVMTYSSSAIFAEHVYGNSLHFLSRQVIYVAIGSLLMFATAMIPIKFWKEHSRAVILFSIALLIVVFLPSVGHSAGGAKRWIRLGPVNFQPVEFAKIAACLYLSDYLTRKLKKVQGGVFFVLLPPLLMLGALCALLLFQPDLGSCLIIVMMAALLFFVSGIPFRYVAGTLALIAPAFYFLVVRVPYRMSRVGAYLNPWDDPQGSGFQIIQSFLAFGLGGIKGVGLGQSAQKLFYLPSSYNDFIFSVIGEELGLLGACCVLLLYMVIFGCGIQMIRKAKRDFDKLFTLSLIMLIILQAILNMLVSTGLIPTKGLPLPFVSYGGTSLVFNLMTVGLLLSMDRHLKTSR